MIYWFLIYEGHEKLLDKFPKFYMQLPVACGSLWKMNLWWTVCVCVRAFGSQDTRRPFPHSCSSLLLQQDPGHSSTCTAPSCHTPSPLPASSFTHTHTNTLPHFEPLHILSLFAHTKNISDCVSREWCVCVCVYLLSEQSTGQKATAVAESPTSKMDEQGLISWGGSASSDVHGPQTITWTHTGKELHSYKELTYIITALIVSTKVLFGGDFTPL